MEYEFAPLEGITDALYRRTHQKYYPGVSRYYTPFISPTQHHVFTARQLRELDLHNNGPIPPVPQLLGKNAEDFLWAARELAAMGYGVVNLNLGCPSGTVAAKGKGAGFLAHPEELDAFLETIFRSSPLPISVKTRIGAESPEEFQRLLAIYERYPICRLIVHPRTRVQFYKGTVHREAFAWAAQHTTLPLCYNGDLFTPEDCIEFRSEFPSVPSIMLGRGLVADPALVGKLTGHPGGKETLRCFMEELSREYYTLFGGPSSAMHRMKAIWAYVLCSFRDGEAFRKALVKAKRWDDLTRVTEAIFQTLELLPSAKGVGEHNL